MPYRVASTIEAKRALEQAKKDIEDLVPSCIHWRPEDCADWIEKIGLKQYRECFTFNHISGRKLILLDCNSLPKVGIQDYDHIKYICAKLRQLLQIDFRKWDRSIALMPKTKMETYLEAKCRSGSQTNNLILYDWLRSMEIRYAYDDALAAEEEERLREEQLSSALVELEEEDEEEMEASRQILVINHSNAATDSSTTSSRNETRSVSFSPKSPIEAKSKPLAIESGKSSTESEESKMVEKNIKDKIKALERDLDDSAKEKVETLVKSKRQLLRESLDDSAKDVAEKQKPKQLSKLDKQMVESDKTKAESLNPQAAQKLEYSKIIHEKKLETEKKE